MTKIEKQIKQLQRMLDYRKQHKEPGSYIMSEIAALINAIEAMELIHELKWDYILTTRLTRKVSNEKDSTPATPDGTSSCEDQSGNSLRESSASL